MSEYEQVIDEIVKHGVVVKVNKIVDDNYIPYERKYVGCVVKLDFSEHDKPFEYEIAKREEAIGYYRDSLSSVEKNCDKLYRENKELKQRIAELENEKAENCEEKTISDDTRPSAEWYENRYQQDCITINRLNTTIDVLIHKIEYLRQFAGLE